MNYDAQVDKNFALDYQRLLNKEKEEKEKEKKVEKAKNDKFYLQSGKYSIRISKDGREVEKELVVE